MEENRTDKLLEMIAAEGKIPRERLTLSTKVEDLGLDSLDFISLIQDIGEKFKEIPDSKIAGLETVGDILKAIE